MRCSFCSNKKEALSKLYTFYLNSRYVQIYHKYVKVQIYINAFYVTIFFIDNLWKLIVPNLQHISLFFFILFLHILNIHALVQVYCPQDGIQSFKNAQRQKQDGKNTRGLKEKIALMYAEKKTQEFHQMFHE